MALRFPQKAEIRLSNPPLNEVVCQVKFPPVLRIGKESPSDLQEKVRERFPQLEVEQAVQVQVPGIGSQGAPTVHSPAPVYRFKSPEGETSISLAIDFLAVSTTHYSHWDSFLEDLRFAWAAVQAVYKPPYLTRVGLRYVNQFGYANTGSSSVAELISFFATELTTQLRCDAWSDPDSMTLQLLLTQNGTQLALRTAFGRDEGGPSMILDLDCFVEGRTSVESLWPRLTNFHENIYAAFRWSVSDDKLAAFSPLTGEA
jgi:uncharacterized protein (TIGR04255 family)